jgi:glutamate-ammonia-ligase adenylyltransferase
LIMREYRHAAAENQPVAKIAAFSYNATMMRRTSPLPPGPERARLALQEAFIRSGSHYPVQQFMEALEGHLHTSPAPAMALTNLVRFSEATVSKASLFNDLLHYPVVMDVLMRIFGHSQYFADILVRDPGIFRWLTTSDALASGPSADELSADVSRILLTFAKPEGRRDALKRAYRRQMIRIGTRDLLGVADLEATTRDLSILADAMIDAVVHVAMTEAAATYGGAPDTPFVIIGLGKLGGVELNYSSDIDVMFVYGDEGTVGRVSHHEFFNRLAERIVQSLSQPTAEGHLYRVDTRLRPESGAGPLARSLGSTLVYYEARGELWERQMLLKARPVGGDRSFGLDVLRQLEPFIYPRTHFQNPAESVVRIKARIERAIGDEDNIKLRAGGIRDIEFIVQVLQMINGGKDRSLRQTGTLSALAALAVRGLLTPPEIATLTDAYVFLRRVEHALQTMFNRQTHVMPGAEDERRTVALRLGLASAEELLLSTRRHTRSVKEIFDRVLATPMPGENRDVLSLLDTGLREGERRIVAGGLGFRDHRKVASNIKVLVSGSSLTGRGEVDARTQDALRAVAPQLFDAIGKTPDPDYTLANVTTLISAQKVQHQIYTQLDDPRFRKLVIDLCAASGRLVRGLIGEPLLLETIASDIGTLAGRPDSFLPPAGQIAAFKRWQELRIALRHVLGFTSLDDVMIDLAAVADFVLTSVTSSVAASSAPRRRGTQAPLALFALGKYGSRERLFDGDLDILFVGSGTSAETRERHDQRAQAILTQLAAATPHGELYDVDVRLRPEGRNAPLVTDRARLQDYLTRRASLWERQTLTRLRFVTGDPALGKGVMADVSRYVFGTPLPAQWSEAIVAMRRKMEPQSRTRGVLFDFKRGAGGMVDVEFVTQMLMLGAGEDGAPWVSKPVAEILAGLGGRWLSGQESGELAHAYAFFRTLEMAQSLVLDERGTILPEGEKLETLARCVDRSSGPALAARVRAYMAGVRTLFLTISRRVQ